MEQDIYLYPPNGQRFALKGSETKSLHVVTLDLGCTEGNWISADLVKRLGMEDNIRLVRHPPNISDYHGRPIYAAGMISFKWKHLDGTKMHDPVEFYIGSRNGIDMIFGRKYCLENQLVSINVKNMLPMMKNREKLSPGK